MNDDLLDKIQIKLQKILDKKFAGDTYIKKKIDKFHDRWNFACPYCGDSRTSQRKKRGNLYLDNLGYKCFNCGHHTGIRRLLAEFGEPLSQEESIAVRDIQVNAKHYEKRTATTQSSMLYTILDELAIPKKIFFDRLNLVSPYKNEECSTYLKSRMIDITKWKYFAYKIDSKELFILNINNNDRIIGYQIRQLNKNTTKPRYLTRNVTWMYKDVFNIPSSTIIEKLLSRKELGEKYIEEEDGLDNIVANIEKISGIFNIMNIDTSRTLTVVEGPIDSLAIDNCVALQGAKKMNDYFDSIETVRYLFDKDVAGKEESIKKLRKHKSVFLWDMYIKKKNIKVKVKDINDLQKTNNFNNELLNNCFSDDELDIVMI